MQAKNFADPPATINLTKSILFLEAPLLPESSSDLFNCNTQLLRYSYITNWITVSEIPT